MLGFLVWQLGTGPFLDGLRATSPWAVAGGAGGHRRDDVVLRRALVAGLGAVRQDWAERVPLRTAYVAYYRSQLINATVPGGVVGDVHRAVRHGWRGVVWERGSASSCRSPWSGRVLLPGGWRWAGLAAVARRRGWWPAGAVRASSSAAGAWPGTCWSSWSRRSRWASTLTPLQLLPIGALVLLGSAIPLNVAGWGPREGVAAWAFAAFGLDGRGRADRRGDVRRARHWWPRCPGSSLADERRRRG